MATPPDLFTPPDLANCGPTTLNVTYLGSTEWLINGVANPSLTLCTNTTYTFNIAAPGHPFYIKTSTASLGTANAYSTGVTFNGASVGTVTFTVPSNAPSTLYYACGFHFPQHGTINIVSP